MTQLPFDGVGAVGEDPLNPFVEEKARTVDKLVKHTRGQVVWKFNLDAPLGSRFEIIASGLGFAGSPI